MCDPPPLGSRERKILFHLQQHAAARNSLVAPYWVTQAGIAERTGLTQPNVSTAIRALAAAGLATMRIGLVEGERRTKSVYFLSDAGLSLASQAAEGTAGTVCHPASLPLAKPCFGRERELGDLDEWLRSGGERLLYIQGMAGIGKTTLLLTFLERARQLTSVFYFRIHPWTTQAQMLAEMGEFLASLSRPALRSLLEGTLRHGARLDLGAALHLLREDLRGLRALLAFEDYHDAPPEVRDLVGALAESIEEGGARLLADGRAPVPPFDPRAVRTGRARSLALAGLDQAAVGALLRHRGDAGGGVADAERVHRATGGNPLFIQLLPTDADLTRPGDLRSFLAQEIEGRLPVEEVGLLRALSVYRRPVPLEAFAGREKVDIVGDLVARALVEIRDADGGYGMHALLREYFYHSLSAAEREVWHTAAAKYYSGRESIEDRLEMLWHLAAAGEPAELASALLRHGPGLLRAGNAPALLSVISTPGVDSADRSLRLLRARCLLAVGELEKGREEFESALEAARTPEQRARACEGVTYCLTMSGDSRGAATMCAQGLRHAQRIRDRTSRNAARAALLKELGSARIVAGDYRGAIKALETALRATRGLGDLGLLAGCHNSLGMAHRGLGDFATAREHFERSSGLVKQLGDPRLGALSLNNLGVAQWAEGDYDGAVASMSEALRGAGRIGDRLAAMYSRLNLGIIAANQGRKEEAIAYIERALAGAREAGSEWDAAVARADLADVLLQCGDPAGALRELELAERVRSPAGDPVQRVQWSLVGMRACLGLGRLKEAEKRYRAALAAGGMTRSAVLRAVLDAAGAELGFKSGRLSEAVPLAKSAAAFCRRGLGDFREGANALALLGEVLLASGETRAGRQALEEAAARYKRLGAKADAARCRALAGAR